MARRKTNKINVKEPVSVKDSVVTDSGSAKSDMTEYYTNRMSGRVYKLSGIDKDESGVNLLHLIPVYNKNLPLITISEKKIDNFYKSDKKGGLI